MSNRSLISPSLPPPISSLALSRRNAHSLLLCSIRFAPAWAANGLYVTSASRSRVATLFFPSSFHQARYCLCLEGRYGSLSSRNTSCLDKSYRAHIISQAQKKSRKYGNRTRKHGSPFTSGKSRLEDIRFDEDEYKESIDTSSLEDQNSSSIVSDSTDCNVNLYQPSRGDVLQACAATSGLLFAGGLILRQASYIAFTQGWLKTNSPAEISFDFESWHLELILGLVALVTACRFILLRIWPDFAKSSAAANKQVLSSLEPVDYVFVSFLPGIGEELLFRGALLPLLGVNWQSALVIGAVFGGLHLGNSRNYSFVIWASFVGFTYGLAAIASSSIIVPMVAHSLNNLVGGILWRQDAE